MDTDPKIKRKTTDTDQDRQRKSTDTDQEREREPGVRKVFGSRGGAIQGGLGEVGCERGGKVWGEV